MRAEPSARLCPKYSGPKRDYCFGEVYREASSYYSRMDLDVLARKAQVAQVIAGELPNISEIYGVGYPFYGPMDVGKRMVSTAKRYVCGQETPNNFVQRIIPDIDLLVVFPSQQGPYQVRDVSENRLKESFVKSMALYQRQWRKLYQVLERDFGVCNRERDAMEAFMERGLLHVDFAPIPAHIWQDLPCLVVAPEDWQNIIYIRDVMFTCDPLLDNKKSSVPQRFRENFILVLLKEEHLSSWEAVWQKIIDQHPYNNLLVSNGIAVGVVKQRWEKAFLALFQDQKIKKEGQILILSESGKRAVGQILIERQRIYNQGFEIP